MDRLQIFFFLGSFLAPRYIDSWSIYRRINSLTDAPNYKIFMLLIYNIISHIHWDKVRWIKIRTYSKIKQDEKNNEDRWSISNSVVKHKSSKCHPFNMKVNIDLNCRKTNH